MSNNKQSMKLYTEEQVNELRRALRDIAQWDEFLGDDWEDVGNRAMDALRCFQKITPIELPSDEEIYDCTYWHGLYRAGFFDGTKWMRDKIQGGNNEQ